VIVDTPQGSRTKYRYDKARQLFRLTKVLPAGAFLPFNFGYVPSTRGEDGDGLDVVVLIGSSRSPSSRKRTGP
jgi:inorganic pyrophosphatase